MPLPSASKVGLAMVCPASAVLPKTDRLNDAADEGHGIHAFMRSLPSMSREEALARVQDEYRTRCEDIDLDLLPPPSLWKAETAFAYDVETEGVRFLGYDIGRNYGPRETPTEMFMSLDALIIEEGVATVLDWKTGRGRLPPADDNWQLRVQALAVQRHTGCELVRVAVVRLPDGGKPYFDWAEFGEFDLAMFASELRELARRLEKPEVTPVMGEHCRYCPAFEACPGQGRLLARMAGDSEQLMRDVLDTLTPETAWKAYERVRAVEGVLKRMWTALFAYAQETPIVLGDGTVFGPVETQKEELDAGVVRQVLGELHGPEVAEKACDFETSKAAIERALRLVYESRKAAGQGTTLKALKDEALAAIREAGGASVKLQTKVKEHQPREEVLGTLQRSLGFEQAGGES